MKKLLPKRLGAQLGTMKQMQVQNMKKVLMNMTRGRSGKILIKIISIIMNLR